MATTTSSAALLPISPVFTNNQRLALAGFPAGHSNRLIGASGNSRDIQSQAPPALDTPEPPFCAFINAG